MNAVTSLRNQSNAPLHPSSSRELGWWGVLPPVSRGSRRWWLPLSDTALVALSTAISESTGDWDNPNPLATQQLVAAMSADPPLLLYASMRWPGDDFVSVTELAQWLIGFAPQEFSGGQWLLSAPEITTQHQHRWSRLLLRCRALDPKHWSDHAADWLQVIGPAVDADLIETMPAVIWDNEGQSRSQVAGSQLLQRLAGSREREIVTESNLSALAEKRKHAAAKQLAYGLSHEINNPLANISARAQQLAHQENDPQRNQSLLQIVQQVYRAHEMIAGLMFFANPPEPNLERVDLSALVQEVADEFKGSAADAEIHLIAETPGQPAVVSVDRTMMLEAIRVLVRNSIEAIGSGGTVVVSLDSDGDLSCWRIHVADSGPGLSVEDCAHAFDPFYSGREAGRGLGLGLCRAYRVVKLHGAQIHLSGGLAGCVATISIAKMAESESRE